MREILFRGKRTDGKEWIYGSYIQSNSSWKGGHPHRAWIAEDAMSNGGWFALQKRLPVIDETVGQYTGVLDKNGVRVFEGDIVRTQFGRLVRIEYRAVEGFVGFDMTAIECKHKFPWSDMAWCSYNIEVVGNIHDNPEMVRW